MEIKQDFVSHKLSSVVGDRGGGSLGEKKARGVGEVGEEGAGRRILKVSGSRRKREKLICNIAQYFAMEKHKEATANKNRVRTRIKGIGSGKFKPPPPVPPTQMGII